MAQEVTSLRKYGKGAKKSSADVSLLDMLESKTPYTYAHPLPGAALISPFTTVAFRTDEPIDGSTAFGKISLKGAKSGDHSKGETVLLSGRTVHFRPAHPLAPGEQVHVNVAEGIKTGSGKSLPAVEWSFHVSWRKLDTYHRVFLPLSVNGSHSSTHSSRANLHLLKKIRSDHFLLGLGAKKHARERQSTRMSIGDEGGQEIEETIVPNPAYRTLPPKYPRAVMRKLGDLSKLSPGYLFTAEIDQDPDEKTMKVIMTDRGDPVFYELGTLPTFAPTHNKQLVIRQSDNAIVVAGNDYRKKARFQAQHGHIINHHEFQMLSNGNSLILIYDPQLVDAKKIRPGVSGATRDTWAVGLIIQEVTPKGHVVFDWRSWDFLPRVWWETNMVVENRVWDLTHGNSLEEAPDGNIIVSMRALWQVTKINRNSGRIMWRLGGVSGNLKVAKDPNGLFSGQHDARLHDGLLTVFDNSVKTGSRTARAVDYKLDGSKATMVSLYDTGIAAFAKGNYRRMPNGNRVICLGLKLPPGVKGERRNPWYLETDDKGRPLVQMQWRRETHSYRVVKGPWQGFPRWQPKAIIDNNNSAGQMRLHFSWNGATEVDRWRVYRGEEKIADLKRTQFEHWVDIPEARNSCQKYQAVAVGRDGRELNRSKVAKSKPCSDEKTKVKKGGGVKRIKSSSPACDVIWRKRENCAADRLTISQNECEARGCCYKGGKGQTVEGLVRCFKSSNI
ncbi:unnamed protein product [Vitrella brassicaformis CCMP3155]|uniref:P-type domain-containing protein n=1 Tax=Vitrella brassicaformis (strain CCMP3155) TaxID=1169540 RepID=A0A0G4GSA2_VITBC|nr:unnamed protein product [Vitrella brassicaformis CCMP3155]|eukprot:CEM33479.1 unnamed protein product [Vitrella brassicaformis CCMP3155]